MTTKTKTWLPDKAPENYSDVEVTETPVYKKMEKALPGSAVPVILSVTREALRGLWEEIKNDPLVSSIRDVFRLAVEQGAVDADGSLLINGDGSYSIPGKAGREVSDGGRFKAKDYVEFIGKGNNHPKAQHGGFVREVVQAKVPSRNGTYELVISAGKDAKTFSVKLHQRPANGAALPVVSFPPVDPKNPVVSAQIVEVKSMAQLLRQSILNMPTSPAVWFGLKTTLQKVPQGPSKSI